MTFAFSLAPANNSGYDIICAPGTSYAASCQLNQNNDCYQHIFALLGCLKVNCARCFTSLPSWIDKLRREGEEEAAEPEFARKKWAMWWRRPSQLCRASCRWTPSPVRQNSPPPQNWDTLLEASPTFRRNMWVFLNENTGCTRQLYWRSSRPVSPATSAFQTTVGKLVVCFRHNLFKWKSQH